MRDPHFGHRNWKTGAPEGDRDEKTEWDFALMSAYQVIQDNTDSNGILIWENEADNIEVNADRKISKFDSARERKTSGKKYKAQPGERYVPNVKKMYGEWPTWSDWIQKQADSEE